MRNRVYCGWCGADIGESVSCYNVLESCGEPECDREVRLMERAEREQRMLDAAEDDYERY